MFVDRFYTNQDSFFLLNKVDCNFFFTCENATLDDEIYHVFISLLFNCVVHNLIILFIFL